MSRFEAIGHSVYEKGDRIGCTPDEAAVELARKLNAYQMRVERLKAKPHDDDTCPHLVRANLLEAENARLKAEVERLTTIAPKGLFDFSVEHLTRLFKDGRIAEASYEGERSQWYCSDAYARCVRAEIEIKRLKAEVEELKALTAEMDSTINVSQAACREYKAEVERLEEIVGSDAIDRKYGMCCDASDEIARLKAEVERLTNDLEYREDLALRVKRITDQFTLPEVYLLRAQVERLTKAGDFMADCLGSNSCWSHLDGLVADWNAAKEGKQPNG